LKFCQTDPVHVLCKLTANWFELCKLHYASYLWKGIRQTPCSFKHVSCVSDNVGRKRWNAFLFKNK